jgi:hypothetical protein
MGVEEGNGGIMGTAHGINSAMKFLVSSAKLQYLLMLPQTSLSSLITRHVSDFA